MIFIYRSPFNNVINSLIQNFLYAIQFQVFFNLLAITGSTHIVQYTISIITFIFIFCIHLSKVDSSKLSLKTVIQYTWYLAYSVIILVNLANWHKSMIPSTLNGNMAKIQQNKMIITFSCPGDGSSRQRVSDTETPSSGKD